MPVCYAIQHPVYGPAMRLIASITQSKPALVTTTFNHGYVTGTIVRLEIPKACGMQQAQQAFGPILIQSPTTFYIDIDTTSYDAFTIPSGLPPWVDICAQVVPIGEVNETLLAAVQNMLP